MGVEWARDILQWSFKIIQQYVGRKITQNSLSCHAFELMIQSLCLVFASKVTGKSLGWHSVEAGAISSLFILLLTNSTHGSISTIYYSLILTTTTTRQIEEILFSKNSQVLSSNLYIIPAPHLSSLMSALLFIKMFEMVSIWFLCDRISI